MLHGRWEELGALLAVADDAREWAGRALVLAGEPGIGKTALLHEFAETSADEGLLVLMTRGSENETAIPFAALSVLLRPLAPHIADLPAGQAALLNGALGFAEPFPTDPFAVAAAALNLLGLASSAQPIVLIVDDAQWLDPGSLMALLFVCGRLADQAISVVIGTREGEDKGMLSRLETLELSGLDETFGRALLQERYGDRIPEDVADSLVGATAGNPLALLEVPQMLSQRQCAGLEPLTSPLPAGDMTSAAFRQRVTALPARTRRVLVVAAAAGDDLAVVTAGIRELGLNPEDLDPAVDERLVRIDSTRIKFRHALVRSVVYHEATASERRDAHRALARVLPEDDARRAWHLATAAIGPDEETATALEAVAVAAITRSGLSEASIAFGHAAQLSIDPHARARRQLGAAQMALYVGDFARAKAITAEAVSHASGEVELARAQQLRGRVDIWFPERPLTETAARILAEAACVEQSDLDLALAMIFEASFALFAAGDVRSAQSSACRALELARRGSSETVQSDTELLALWTNVLAGSEEGVIETMVDRVARFDRSRPEAAQFVLFLDVPLLLMSRHDEFLASLATAIDEAREAAALIPLAMQLSIRADGEMQMGRWRLAEIDAHEAIELSPPGSSIATYPHATLARIASFAGNAEACRQHAAAAMQLIEIGGVGSIGMLVRGALAVLEQSLGNYARALELHMANAAEEEFFGVGNPLVTRTPVGMVEAAAHVGRPELAVPYQKQLERAASTLHAPTLHALAAYGRGLLATDPADSQDAFEESLAWHASAGRPFEEACARLAYGERLRRDRQRAESRRHLRRALAIFNELTCEPWAERAARELRATGETTHPRVATSRALLTPQEHQVARLAADGLSNAEIATRLFISPKTVEKHLTTSFRKLDVSSRRDLIRSGGELLEH